MNDSKHDTSQDKKTPSKPAYEKPTLSVLAADQTEVGTVVVSESAPFGS